MTKRMLYSFKAMFVLLCAAISVESCYTKVYPDEKLAIDPQFSSLFYSVTKEDTIRFNSSSGRSKSFVITKVDSIITNRKGWFINEKPYKLLRCRFKEVGTDTVSLERENEIFVNKDPATNISSLCIKFNNLYYCKDSVLPPINHAMSLVNNKEFTNYYLLETSLHLKNSDDVKVLYISIPQGFLGFKTYSGEVWVNERD